MKMPRSGIALQKERVIAGARNSDSCPWRRDTDIQGNRTSGRQSVTMNNRWHYTRTDKEAAMAGRSTPNRMQDPAYPVPEEESRALHAELEESIRAADAGHVVDARTVLEEMRTRVKAAFG